MPARCSPRNESPWLSSTNFAGSCGRRPRTARRGRRRARGDTRTAEAHRRHKGRAASASSDPDDRQQHRGTRDRLRQRTAAPKRNCNGSASAPLRRSDRGRLSREFAAFTDPPEGHRTARRLDADPADARAAGDPLQDRLSRGRRRQPALGAHLPRRLLDRHVRPRRSPTPKRATPAPTGPAIWQAGGIEEQERDAWRALAAQPRLGPRRLDRAAVPTGEPGGEAGQAAPANDVILTSPTVTACAGGRSTRQRRSGSSVVARRWRCDADRPPRKPRSTPRSTPAARPRSSPATSRPTSRRPRCPTGHTKSERESFQRRVRRPSRWRHKARAPGRTPRSSPSCRIGSSSSATTGGEPAEVVVGNPVPSPLVAGPDPSAPREPTSSSTMPRATSSCPDETEVALGLRSRAEGRHGLPGRPLRVPSAVAASIACWSSACA